MGLHRTVREFLLHHRKSFSHHVFPESRVILVDMMETSLVSGMLGVGISVRVRVRPDHKGEWYPGKVKSEDHRFRS